MTSAQEILSQLIQSFTQGLSSGDIQTFDTKYYDRKYIFTVGTSPGEISVFRDVDKDIKTPMGTHDYEIQKYKLVASNQIGDTILGGFTLETIITDKVTKDSYSYNLRVSLVLELTRKGPKIRQWHTSVPEYGNIKGDPWRSSAGIKEQMSQWMSYIDTNVIDNAQKSKIKDYLMKAKELID